MDGGSIVVGGVPQVAGGAGLCCSVGKLKGH
jgi:hypothetical protein